MDYSEKCSRVHDSFAIHNWAKAHLPNWCSIAMGLSPWQLITKFQEDVSKVYKNWNVIPGLTRNPVQCTLNEITAHGRDDSWTFETASNVLLSCTRVR